MIEKYPYLVFWVRLGLDVLPFEPPEAAIPKIKEAFLRGLKRSTPHIAMMSMASGNNPEQKQEEMVSELYRELYEDSTLIEELFMATLAKRFDEMIYEFGLRNFELRKKYLTGDHKRDGIAREWANDFLPKSQGGSALLTDYTILVLNEIYFELIDCIKEIRKHFNIPLINKKGSIWPYPTNPKEISDLYPASLMFFSEKELPLLYREPSVSASSLKIIIKRIKPNLRFDLTERTLLKLFPVLKK